MRTKRATMGRVLALLTGLLLGGGCGSSSGDAAGEPPTPGTGLAPGGAQDFGRFKALLDAGKLPGPQTLDQVGFFAEHKLGDAPTSCPDAVCAQALFGAMGNLITGTTCTLVHLSLGTPLDPRTLPRPAMDVAVVIDLRGTNTGEVATGAQQAVERLLVGLEATDTVTLIALDQRARVLTDKVPVSGADQVRQQLGKLLTLGSGGELYAGLRTAVDLLATVEAGRNRRMIVVSAGGGDGAIPLERSTRLVRGFAQAGGSVTVVAQGDGKNTGILQGLADASAGTLYYVSSSAELPALFDKEVAYALLPVAQRVGIRITPGSSYRLREVFGVSPSSWHLSTEGGSIDLPALYAAWRKTPVGSNGNRRGGGGGILIEVMPRTDAPRVSPATVGDIEISYTPSGGTPKTTRLQVQAPDGPWGTPASGRFASASVEKGFVVLNLYVAFRMAAERTESGDLRGAYDSLFQISRAAGQWNQTVKDPEIASDLHYVGLFLSRLEAAGALAEPPRATQYIEPWPRD